jgi:hypothetical protein
MDGSVTRWLSDGAGLRAGLTYAPSRFSVHNGEAAANVLGGTGAGRGEPHARLDVWQASATAVFRFPLTLGRLVPYGLAGAGIVHYRTGLHEDLPPEARRRFEKGTWTAPAAVMGIGATLPLQRRNLLMNFELTNHLTPTPLNDEGRGEAFEMNGVPLELHRYASRDTDGIGMTSHLRLTVGITLPVRP